MDNNEKIVWNISTNGPVYKSRNLITSIPLLSIEIKNRFYGPEIDNNWTSLCLYEKLSFEICEHRVANSLTSCFLVTLLDSNVRSYIELDNDIQYSDDEFWNIFPNKLQELFNQMIMASIHAY